MEKHEINQTTDVVVERATAEDVKSIEPMVKAAYTMYVDRLGKLPAAMTADYGVLIASGNTYVLRAGGKTVGAVLLEKEQDSINLSNLVVDPKVQGHGYGRLLMEFAEKLALAEGLPAITLFTNVLMHENISLYTKLGFTQTDRKIENGYDRIYFRKRLGCLQGDK